MANNDFEEFIAALNANGVRYLVIGAHAVAFHARPRATKDLDILIEPEPDNARRTVSAMQDFFGGVELDYTIEDLLNPDWIIQLGVAPVRIDLQSEIQGCPDFEKAWENRVSAVFGSVPAHYIGLDDLINSKSKTGRPQDRADVSALRRLKNNNGQRNSAVSRKKPKK